jgi:two-component system cell cycle response regulator
MHKILVIDDQPDSILILREHLRRAGYDVYTAASGKAGLELAVQVKPDAILLDIMMPDMDGYEVCGALQSCIETAIIPILFVSARIQPEDIQEGLSAGAADYIKKPVEFVELLARIASIIRQRELIEKQLADEKMQTFSATIVSANHHLKQPLTLINLATTAVRRLILKSIMLSLKFLQY